MSDDELVEAMGEAIYMRCIPQDFSAQSCKENDPGGWQEAVDDARAALAVAEPAIRERCAVVEELDDTAKRTAVTEDECMIIDEQLLDLAMEAYWEAPGHTREGIHAALIIARDAMTKERNLLYAENVALRQKLKEWDNFAAANALNKEAGE